MKDSEIKVLLGVGIVGVIALPYFLYSQQAKTDTATIKNECTELQATYDRLNEMNQNRKFYEDETERYLSEMKAIIELYPSDIQQPNYTLWLLNTEYSSLKYVENEEGEMELTWVYPLRFDTVAFTNNEEIAISADDTDTGMVALTNMSGLTYRTYYDGLKYMLEYIMDYKDPMIYTQISMSMDQETGVITGTMLLEQYAVLGNGVPFEPVGYLQEFDGVAYNFSLDNNNVSYFEPIGTGDIRGNEEAGIFGLSDKEMRELYAGEDGNAVVDADVEVDNDEE